MSVLISSEMLRLNQAMHQSGQGYGGGGWKHAEVVLGWLIGMNATTMLDYGCGEGSLKTALNRYGWNGIVYEYDPAIKQKSRPPRPAPLVVCTDVMEHVEESSIAAVLAHIRSLAEVAAYFAIATRPSNKDMPNGKNAHVTLRPADWWCAQITPGWSQSVAYAYKGKDEAPREVRLWLRR